MVDFEYETFADARSEIRLLTIFPGSVDDPLSCELNTFRLSSLPPYEAISYTWGDNAAETPMQINGKRFVAPGNAYEGLVELRDPVSPRRIWIDAIYINQTDLTEKQHQILLMRDVYERAEEVVVWLPRPRGEPDLVVGLLDEHGSCYTKETSIQLNVLSRCLTDELMLTLYKFKLLLGGGTGHLCRRTIPSKISRGGQHTGRVALHRRSVRYLVNQDDH